MKTSLDEKLRLFIVNWLFTSISGITMDEWMRMLRQHYWAIDLPYWPRAAFTTGMSINNSILHWFENKMYGPQVRNVKVTSPIFILGHWRSGTTQLQYLMATDQQFAFPNYWQVLNPHTFLLTEQFSGLLRLIAPKTRMIDNLSLSPQHPSEDELAFCGTLCSPYMSWVFPQYADYYDRYLTFRDVPADEVERWKSALHYFYQKLTWKYQRPLLIKSPPHTCRIKLLLEMFPDARFIHIHRDPFEVFRSTKRQIPIVSQATHFQNPDWHNINDWIIHRYKVMYDIFFEERDLIPAGQFHEIRYTDLVNDPLGQIQCIYEKLNLPGVAAAQPAMQQYLDSLGNYQKNNYTNMPSALRSLITQAWRRSFEVWDYPTHDLSSVTSLARGAR